MQEQQTNEQTSIPTFTEADKREAVFHNFDVEAEVTGKLKTIQKGDYGDQYIITTLKKDVTVGTYDVLKSKIKIEDVGKWIKIVYNGFVQSKKTKSRYKDFDVFVK